MFKKVCTKHIVVFPFGTNWFKHVNQSILFTSLDLDSSQIPKIEDLHHMKKLYEQ